MKKQTIIKISAIAVFLSLGWFNTGSLRCEPLDALSNGQPQARIGDRKPAKTNDDQDFQEEKSQRFHVLEWLIMQNLLKEYEKIEVAIHPEAELD
jgi:hypothetical protein